MLRILFCAGLLICLVAGRVSAQPLNFDITSLNPGNTGTAAGTSNGVAWMISPTFISNLSVSDGTFTGFNTSSFVPPIAATDVLHVTSADFTLSFNQRIDSILFYLRENDGGASLDFGLAPTIISGNFTVVGTRIFPAQQDGGVVRFNGVDSTTLSHSSIEENGMDIAFFVLPATQPAPAMSRWSLLVLLFLLVAGGIATTRRIAAPFAKLSRSNKG
jgi:hypothetical protein